MSALRVKFAAAAATLGLVLAAFPGRAQSDGQFDSRPTGFLTATTGGMPANAWGGTSLGTAKQLVSALAPAPRSRALRDLQFKVLVSELKPPAADGSAPPSLFARKVDRLAAMGEAESLNEMVRGAGGYADPSIALTVVNALLMAGERAAACAIARNNPLVEPFARRVDATCKIAAGDTAGALAAAAALRSSDPGFAKLVEISAQGTTPTAVSPAQIDGPAMAMLDLSFVQPSAATLRSTQPSIIRSLVAHRTLPIVTRLDIAERAEALAIIETSQLGDLYLEAVRDGVVLPAPMSRRARLVAAARGATNADELLKAIAAAYGEARGSALFPTIARASASALLNLPAKPEFANVAQEAMRGFLLLGDKQQTRAWMKLALSAAMNNARAMNAVDRLLPLAAVIGVEETKRLAPEQLNRWYQVMRQDDPAQAPLRGYLMLQLARAVGINIPQGSTELPETPPAGARLVSPPAATLQALQSAAAGQRRAETALLAAIAVGETPLADLHPAAVGIIVRAVRQVGEDDTGRLLAIEIAISHGL